MIVCPKDAANVERHQWSSIVHTPRVRKGPGVMRKESGVRREWARGGRAGGVPARPPPGGVPADSFRES